MTNSDEAPALFTCWTLPRDKAFSSLLVAFIVMKTQIDTLCFSMCSYACNIQNCIIPRQERPESSNVIEFWARYTLPAKNTPTVITTATTRRKNSSSSFELGLLLSPKRLFLDNSVFWFLVSSSAKQLLNKLFENWCDKERELVIFGRVQEPTDCVRAACFSCLLDLFIWRWKMTKFQLTNER